ncbi:hypothetical protein M378DRAFT_157502 [Amanita muscaria Koide BX008]|uniref:Uncharacterized protein n=1 Tax=Amanita muscaria (strain Koide BX008) TaxID=946122 RepID=A0A0C2X4Q8_AMAMK|nr:hypothetical protein M378DRAFT_157502 [Amanita muscaria Koide BX008]
MITDIGMGRSSEHFIFATPCLSCLKADSNHTVLGMATTLQQHSEASTRLYLQSDMLRLCTQNPQM